MILFIILYKQVQDIYTKKIFRRIHCPFLCLTSLCPLNPFKSTSYCYNTYILNVDSLFIFRVSNFFPRFNLLTMAFTRGHFLYQSCRYVHLPKELIDNNIYLEPYSLSDCCWSIELPEISHFLHRINVI